MKKRHFVVGLHCHMTEIGDDGKEMLAHSEEEAGHPPLGKGVLPSPRIDVWASSPDQAMDQVAERLQRMCGDHEVKG